ncbi:MAG: pyridoxamine 5'-phosphate oxidase family protein, partial [Kangiellaceae bacterium]|nr:pyridoxamine 5'-phosphate oxidase family protein [Kangiellaceae bacterium]
MGHKFAEIAFTEQVKQIQSERNSRIGYAGMEQGEDVNYLLSQSEAEFIQARDSFYIASVSETGWPYVQHRGGPKGFMKVIDAETIGFADYSGNRQYVSTGNFRTNDRVSIIFMDYPNKRRLKLLGRISLVSDGDWEMLARIEDADYRANVERGFVIKIEAFDWNCPQHISSRYTEAEVENLVRTLTEQIEELMGQVKKHSRQHSNTIDSDDKFLGEGKLSLTITGIRQLTPQIRAYEFRDINGNQLPKINAGAHLKIPFLSVEGKIEHRHYSICSNPTRRDIYEIAVQKEEKGRGGSIAIHQTLSLGDKIRCEIPENFFSLEEHFGKHVLIAGGIGITPIKSMAQELQAQGRQFEIHYLGKSKFKMAFADRLQREFGENISFYESEKGSLFSTRLLVENLSKDSVVYICGPGRLIDGLLDESTRSNFPKEQVKFERFAVVPDTKARSFTVELKQAGMTLNVDAGTTILDAILDAGVAIPYSCKVGECKSCQVKVLEGEPEHLDNVLTKSERCSENRMCPCVSRAK